MPVPVSYPGVYIQERASGVRTIASAPTAITAFVGYTTKGVDHRPTRVLSFGDFDRMFGGLSRESELSYAVSQFFANSGGEAVVVRVPKAGAAKATFTLLDESKKKALQVNAISSGKWGEGVALDVTHAGAQDDKSFTLVVTDTGTGQSEAFSNLSMDKTSRRYALTLVNDDVTGSQIVRLSTDGMDADPGRPKRTKTVSDDFAFDAAKMANDKDYGIRLSFDKPAGFAPLLVTLVKKDDPKPQTLTELCRLIERQINLALAPKLVGAAVRVASVETAKAGSKSLAIAVWGDFDQAKLPGTRDVIIKIDAPPAALPPGAAPADALAQWGLSFDQRENAASDMLGSGGDGTALPDSTALIGAPGANATGLWALERWPDFNILCIPDATRAKAGAPTTLDDGLDSNAVYQAALQLCEKRRAFLLVDPPPGARSTDQAASWVRDQLQVRGANAAAYFPRIDAPDPLDKLRLRSFAPSGALAGVYARTDATRGVWKAPAGIDALVQSVAGPSLEMTDSEHGVINPLGLNGIRRFPVYGCVSFGARTLFGADERASEWKYVPVRRTALFIEESLYRGLKWVVFEPNDEPLWAQIRLNVGAFMQSLFLQGAFQGKARQDAYLVKCDRETTTQNDIDRGIVNIVVGFAPLKPAEFVIITLTQLAGQAQV